MGIIRGGDAEYNDDGPSLEEKTSRLEETIGSCLQNDPSVLKLTGKYLALDEVQIISRSDQMKAVKVLDLSDNQVTDEGLKTLFESENLAGLEELHLGINYITDQGLLELVGSSTLALKNLKVLVVSDNKLTDASVSEFVKSPRVRTNRHGADELAPCTCARGDSLMSRLPPNVGRLLKFERTGFGRTHYWNRRAQCNHHRRDRVCPNHTHRSRWHLSRDTRGGELARRVEPDVYGGAACL